MQKPLPALKRASSYMQLPVAQRRIKLFHWCVQGMLCNQAPGTPQAQKLLPAQKCPARQAQLPVALLSTQLALRCVEWLLRSKGTNAKAVV